jgi:hypothetical protein
MSVGGVKGAGIAEVMVQKRGIDILSDRGNVEVKTSRNTGRLKGGKV